MALFALCTLVYNIVKVISLKSHMCQPIPNGSERTLKQVSAKVDHKDGMTYVVRHFVFNFRDHMSQSL